METQRALLFSLLATASMVCGCASTPDPRASGAPAQISYRSDAEFLRARTEVIELQLGSTRVAVAPRLQGRVMTSGFSPGGLSLGWLNRAAIEAGEQDDVFSAFGGQDFLWLGPEGGQFSLFHSAGEPQSYGNRKVPDALGRGGYVVLETGPQAVRMRRRMDLVNARGTELRLRVDRTIRMVERAEAETLIGMPLPPAVTYVGLASENQLTNIGEERMQPDTGTVGLVVRGMFPGRDRAVVVAPFKSDVWGPRVNTGYFPVQPLGRVAIDGMSGVLLFRGDGKVQAKAGLGAGAARDRIGAIDFETRVLTIVFYDRPENADQYVNSLMQAEQTEPYDGDLVTAYSHSGEGGLRYYELASSSPAAFIAPDESVSHTHRTLQFQGALEELSQISRNVLGIDLPRVRWQMP